MATWIIHYAKAGEIGAGNECIVILECNRKPTKRDVEENRKPGFSHVGTHEVIEDDLHPLPHLYTMMAED